MKQQPQQTRSILISVLITVISIALVFYGSIQLSLSASLSNKNMNALAQEVDLDNYLDKPVLAKILNTAIYKWSNAFAGSSLYINEQTVADQYRPEDVRQFLSRIFCNFARSLKGERLSALGAEDIMPLVEPLRLSMQEKLGVNISEETCIAEINAAVRSNGLLVSRPHIVRKGLGIAALVLTLILLLIMLFLRKENLFMGGLDLAVSFGIPALILMLIPFPFQLASAQAEGFPFELWLKILNKTIQRGWLLMLIPVAVGIIIMIAYQIDKRRIAVLSAGKPSKEEIDL